MNTAEKEAIASVANTQPMSVPENPRNRDRYNARSGSHDPQITYWRNIITLSRPVTPMLVSPSCASACEARRSEDPAVSGAIDDRFQTSPRQGSMLPLLLTKANWPLSGAQEGTLMVPCPP